MSAQHFVAIHRLAIPILPSCLKTILHPKGILIITKSDSCVDLNSGSYVLTVYFLTHTMSAQMYSSVNSGRSVQTFTEASQTSPVE